MKAKYLKTLLLCSGLAVFLNACSSHIPPNIREPIENSVDIAQVAKSPELYHSRPIRWAGVILSIENDSNRTRLTVVAFPPDGRGRPIISAQSSGRFIAIVDEFLEPLVYREDREITVFGRFDRLEPGKVGEYEYEFPVVKVDEFYLWPERVERVDYPYPYYGPYLYPHYPFYPWPYYYFPHHRHIHR